LQISKNQSKFQDFRDFDKKSPGTFETKMKQVKQISCCWIRNIPKILKNKTIIG
jgi:hypothetical protein